MKDYLLDEDMTKEVKEFFEEYGFDFEDLKEYSELVHSMMEKEILHGGTTVTLIKNILHCFENEWSQKERRIILSNFILQATIYLITSGYIEELLSYIPRELN